MFTVFLSGDQIQKIKNKSVKESILSEMQTYYSRNLWSSSFGWIMYNTLEVKLANWENKIDFKYNARNSKDDSKEISFTNSFTIEYLAINYEEWKEPVKIEDEITLEFSPYQMSCKIWKDEKNKNLVIITRVNDSQDYCFEINQNNCRLTEMFEEKCNNLKHDAWIKDI